MHVHLQTADLCCFSAADYFLEHDNPAKGVEMLLCAKKADKALGVCEQHNMTITEVWPDSC